ncbi:MAG TPA: alpha/beta fold hydrolase, partial [Jatrophihabitans sp.]|nr:alpha/beta fold hydrolase [Jatrophihabitans sp.]
GAEPTVLERRAGGRVWLVSVRHPCRPDRYFVHRTGPDRCRLLAERRPGHPVAALRCTPIDIPLRDGGSAPGYLSQPTGAGPGPQPMVLLVHGGPWRRVRWEYAERRSRLTELGYTVVEPNFRGSTGFGTGWVNAADRQWGKAMQADLADTIGWAIGAGIADPDRIALFGGSYGGYAVLQLAATSALRLRCVIASSPVTDLVAFVEAPPPFWRSAAPMLRRRIGDPAQPDQRADLLNCSPVTVAAGIDCPVLLLHGANDSRVPARMSSELLLAMARAGRTATLAMFLNEGHEIVSAANRRRYESLISQFLLRELSGLDPSEIADASDQAAFEEPTVRLFHTPAAEHALISGARHGTAVPS